jgi:predicted DNA-binding protein
MAHLKLNTNQWLELGKKLGYLKESTDMSSSINKSENDTYNNEEIEQLISELEDQLLLQSEENKGIAAAADHLEEIEYKPLSETSGELSPEIEERLSKLSHTKQSLFFGSKESPEDKINSLKAKVISVKNTQLERLQVLKDKMIQLKEQALSKRKKHEVASHNTKRIIVFEIKMLLRDISSLENRRNRIIKTLDRTEVLLDKF